MAGAQIGETPKTLVSTLRPNVLGLAGRPDWEGTYPAGTQESRPRRVCLFIIFSHGQSTNPPGTRPPKVSTLGLLCMAPVTPRENYIISDDCLEVMRTMPEKSVHHTITDPPYEARGAHSGQVQERRKERSRHLESVSVIPGLSFEPLSDETRVLYALEFVRITRGWVIVFCQAEAVGKWKLALEYAGSTYKRTCIWVKPNAMPQFSGDRPAQGYEQFVCAWCSPGRSVWYGGGKVGNYTHHIPRGDDRHHETQKPFSLMAEIITDFTAPEELILDPFCGAGTTLLAAKTLGRKYIGIELNTQYAEIVKQRLEDPQYLPEKFRTTQMVLF